MDLSNIQYIASLQYLHFLNFRFLFIVDGRETAGQCVGLLVLDKVVVLGEYGGAQLALVQPVGHGLPLRTFSVRLS